MTPDEVRYALMAQGERVPRPFKYRWLLPWLCSDERRYWTWTQAGAFVAFSALLAVYTGAWWACLLPLGLSGLTFNLKHSMLVDLPALTLALGAAVAWQHGLWWLALTLVIIGSAVKETCAPFAAVFAWSPVLLVGLVSVAMRTVTKSGPDPIPSGPAHDALEHPVAVSWAHHKVLPVWVYVLPWGALLAALAHPTPQLWVALGLGYGGLLIATDAVRLYQWATPVVALCAVPVLGPWALLAVVLHLANPFKTEGL